MAKYFDNLKWIISGQSDVESNSNNNLLKSKNELEFDSTSDSESEYETVYTLNEPLAIDLEEIKKEYSKIHMELIKNEQLVRDRLDSDTIEQIKSNCKEYVNDEIKIIKDFALVMESFNHIKEKLMEFETGMKELETDIKIKTTNQYLSNAELDTRINIIDGKLNNTVEMIEQINSTSNELMVKIVKLENIINTHIIQKDEILKKLNHIESIKSNYSGNWTKYIGNSFGFTKFGDNKIFKIFLGSTCAVGILFVFKYTLNKK